MIFLVAFVITLVWFLCRVAKFPRDQALWAVVTCIVLQLLASQTVLAGVLPWLNMRLSPSMAKLVMNLWLNASRYFLMLFFLISAGGSRRRIAWDGVLLVAVCVAMTAAILATPVEVRDVIYPSGGSLPTDMTVRGVAPFYLIGNAYTAYTVVQAGRWALRYAAESSRRARWGLRVAALGLGCYAALSTARVVATTVRWIGHPGFGEGFFRLVNGLAPTGTLVFIVGVAYVGLAARLAALQVWARHRRIYHELWPLWEQLHAVFPHDELDPTPNHSWRDRLFLRRVHRRYLRRVVEIRDGLVKLSPQLVETGFDPGRPAHDQADVIREALRRQAQGHQPTTRSAVLVAAPATSDINSDVEQLVALARALSKEGIS